MKGDVPEATAMVMDLRENYHIFCSIVVYPVIPKGHIIYRLVPTAVHTGRGYPAYAGRVPRDKKKLGCGGTIRWRRYPIWPKPKIKKTPPDGGVFSYKGPRQRRGPL